LKLNLNYQSNVKAMNEQQLDELLSRIYKKEQESLNNVSE